MAIFTEWQNQNEQRNYPMVDQATGLDDGGIALPNSIITDLRVFLPESLGKYCYISAVMVTGGLVSIAISTINEWPYGAGPFTITPVGTISLPKPITLYKNYSLQIIPGSAGFAGWIALGKGINEETGSWVFTNPQATLLTSRSATFYPDPPVSSVSVEGQVARLQKVIKLSGVTGVVKVSTGIRYVNGTPKPCIIFGLDVEREGAAIMEKFAGPCIKRVTNLKCGNIPLSQINTVLPDSQGNIDIEFKDGETTGGDPAGQFIVGGEEDVGISLDYSESLADNCDPVDQDDPENECSSSSA